MVERKRTSSIQINMFSELEKSKRRKADLTHEDSGQHLIEQKQSLSNFVQEKIKELENSHPLPPSLQGVVNFIEKIPFIHDPDAREYEEKYAILESLRAVKENEVITIRLREVLDIMPDQPGAKNLLQQILDNIDTTYPSDAGRTTHQECINFIHESLQERVIDGEFMRKFFDLLWLNTQTSTATMATLGGFLTEGNALYEKCIEKGIYVQNSKFTTKFQKKRGAEHLIFIRKKGGLSFNKIVSGDLKQFISCDVESQILYNTQTGKYQDYTQKIKKIDPDNSESNDMEDFKESIQSLVKGLTNIQNQQQYHADLIKCRRLLNEQGTEIKSVTGLSFLERIIKVVLNTLHKYRLVEDNDYLRTLNEKPDDSYISFVKPTRPM